MGHQVELVAQGLVELGHPVAHGVHPQRRDGVEVAPAVGVDQLVALGPLDHDRAVVEVGVHVGEPVPHHGGVPLGPVDAGLAGWGVSHPQWCHRIPEGDQKGMSKVIDDTSSAPTAS